MQTTYKDKKLRVLVVTFDTQLQSWELPAFRGAMAQKVGFEHEWFHNHDNANESLHYRYALVQYKCMFGNPVLLCIDKGVEEAHHFFSQPDWSLNIQGDTRAMPIKKLELKEHWLRIVEQPYTYRIYNWMPLGQEDFRIYQGLTGLMDRLAFLQPKLVSHLLHFTQGIDWYVEGRLQLNIQELFEDKFVSFKGQKMRTFNFVFTSNIFIPDMLGLGRGVSHGFGVVRPYAKR
jgi:hypothetical protein